MGREQDLVAAAFIARADHNADLLTALSERNTAAVRDWDGLAAISCRVQEGW
jgi:hypothetical protein